MKLTIVNETESGSMRRILSVCFCVICLPYKKVILLNLISPIRDSIKTNKPGLAERNDSVCHYGIPMKFVEQTKNE